MYSEIWPPLRQRQAKFYNTHKQKFREVKNERRTHTHTHEHTYNAHRASARRTGRYTIRKKLCTHMHTTSNTRIYGY